MSASLFAKYVPLPTLPASLVRSSHCLGVLQKKAYIFGGELKPRTPVDADLSIINLEDGTVEVLSPTPTELASTSSWPAPRVGSSLVALNGMLYLWGGRGGKDMGTFSASEDLWRFDTATRKWEALSTSGEKPEQRSFHVLVASDNHLYLHAGCPPKGRLETLHSLNLNTLIWSSLPSAPLPGRGGTVLTLLPSLSSLARFGGFAGVELGGLDIFDISSGQWRSEEVEIIGGGVGPEKRSVHALIGLSGDLEWEGKKVVGLMAHGEREGAPAELGHDGAGFFHSDAWALLASKSSPPTFSWILLPASKQTSVIPQARGWFASSALKGDKLLMQGGLNEKNERLGDGWTLEVVVE